MRMSLTSRLCVQLRYREETHRIQSHLVSLSAACGLGLPQQQQPQNLRSSGFFFKLQIILFFEFTCHIRLSPIIWFFLCLSLIFLPVPLLSFPFFSFSFLSSNPPSFFCSPSLSCHFSFPSSPLIALLSFPLIFSDLLIVPLFSFPFPSLPS